MRFTVDRCEVFDACEPLAPGSSPDLAALAVASPMMPIERGMPHRYFDPSDYPRCRRSNSGRTAANAHPKSDRLTGVDQKRPA